MAGTAAIYTRISKDREGRELGVQRQEADCRRLAKSLGYDSVVVFQDNDVSASTLSEKPRPEFVSMMSSAERGELAAIIAYSNSRLTRRVAEIQAIINVTKTTGIRVHTVASGQHDLDRADGRASMLTIAVWDQAEAERTSERIKAQKQQRAANGHWHGGAAPFGYRAENKRLIPNPSEVALVAEAAKRVLAGDTLHSVVTDWNARGVTTRFGKHWRQANLRSILMNRSLLGETKAGVKGWEAIIDERDFDRLHRLFSDPARKVTHSPGVKSGKYSMGGGVTVCGYCGKRLITHIRVMGGGRKRSALACLARVHGPDRAHPKGQDGRDVNRVVIDHDRLESYVFETVVAALSGDSRLSDKLSERGPDVDAQITELERQRDAVVEKQRRLNDLYLDGDVDRDYHRDTVASLKAEHAALQNQINDLLGKPLLSAAMSDGLDWKKWTADKRRSFLKAAGVTVRVFAWPEGMARNLGRRRDETAAQHAERVDAHQRAVIEKRVEIVV